MAERKVLYEILVRYDDDGKLKGAQALYLSQYQADDGSWKTSGTVASSLALAADAGEPKLSTIMSAELGTALDAVNSLTTDNRQLTATLVDTTSRLAAATALLLKSGIIMGEAAAPESA